MSFVNRLKVQLEANRNQENAPHMQAYMKNLFPFLGIKTPMRRSILSEVSRTEKEYLKAHCREVVSELYTLKEREYHYCAMEIAGKYMRNNYFESDFEFIKQLITTHSHWDTVDFIAKHILGQFILQYWENRHPYIQELSEADNKWLNRSAILFQLGYKSQTDTDILFEVSKAHAHSKEFFIQKGIGWALREYAKTNPQAVIDFTSEVTLKPLSVREALRRIK